MGTHRSKRTLTQDRLHTVSRSLTVAALGGKQDSLQKHTLWTVGRLCHHVELALRDLDYDHGTASVAKGQDIIRCARNLAAALEGRVQI
jgi:hypothetical protein